MEMVNEDLYMVAALFAGIIIGAIFFGGLWLTIKKGVTSKNPLLWVLGSFILRTGIALVGFYYISEGNWKKLLICLFGFILARLLSKRFLSNNVNKKVEVKDEA
ncbi:MAG TPA: ATP synthase subunit I [Bacteroidales bacterium]|nr:ATP synthase subunit I [Bacteroidales bacterium]